MQQDQGNESGHIVDQPDNEASPKHDCTIAKECYKARQPPRKFDELMGTPIDFSAYVMNRLMIDNSTQEILVGPLSTCSKAHLQASSNLNIISKTVTKLSMIDLIGIIQKGVVFRIDCCLRDDNVLYKFKKSDFLRLNLCDIEDMLFLLVQKKLSNLDIDDHYDLGVALRLFTRCIVILLRVKDLQLGVESYLKKINITRPETFILDIPNMIPYIAYSRNHISRQALEKQADELG
nr:hypothetical protein [Tanacetum cinerariifolium]